MSTKKVIILISVGAILSIVYFILFQKKYNPYKTFSSPNGAYSLVVYLESNPYSFSFNSDFDYRKAYVVLKDKDNNIAVKPPVFSDCILILVI